jgi:hypothetical protein
VSIEARGLDARRDPPATQSPAASVDEGATQRFALQTAPASQAPHSIVPPPQNVTTHVPHSQFRPKQLKGMQVIGGVDASSLFDGPASGAAPSVAGVSVAPSALPSDGAMSVPPSPLPPGAVDDGVDPPHAIAKSNATLVVAVRNALLTMWRVTPISIIR